MDAGSTDPQWQHNMLKAVLLVAVLSSLIFVVYTMYQSSTTEAPTAGNPGGYLQTYRNDVDNVPGEDESSVKRGPPLFTTGLKAGYRCARCSDSGAGDGDATKAATLPGVQYRCPRGASIAWERPEALRRAHENAGVAWGNLITRGPAQEPGMEETGIALCQRLCEAMPETYGTCKATVYNTDTNTCDFFFNCDRVEKDSNSTLFIREFTQQAQPDVVLYDY